FQVVILPITRTSHRMLQRNLVYTAITRSKSKLILLGEISAFDYAVKNAGTVRKTYLVPRFQGEMAEQESKGSLIKKDESKTATTTQTQPPTQPDRKEQVKVVKENNQQLSLLDQDQPEKTSPQPTEYILTVDNLLTI
ncbi:ATP-binding domain-containing protein, partial [Escherichia coli]|uniref:ATP-binding domain-containing protein n=1 Tax=Escherichia coli TaxID=562 RepID=UPI001919D171